MGIGAGAAQLVDSYYPRYTLLLEILPQHGSSNHLHQRGSNPYQRCNDNNQIKVATTTITASTLDPNLTQAYCVTTTARRDTQLTTASRILTMTITYASKIAQAVLHLSHMSNYIIKSQIDI